MFGGDFAYSRGNMTAFWGRHARIACGRVISGRDSQHYRESAASCGESVVFSLSVWHGSRHNSRQYQG